MSHKWLMSSLKGIYQGLENRSKELIPWVIDQVLITLRICLTQDSPKAETVQIGLKTTNLTPEPSWSVRIQQLYPSE